MKLITSTLYLAASIASVNSLLAVTIDTATDYSNVDFSNQTLSASTAILSDNRFFSANLSNTSWAGGASTTPHFTDLSTQDFRFADFSGADWSGVSFTSTSGNQVFVQSDLTNSNFSGATFTLTTGDQMFYLANLSGADFSGATFNVGATFLREAIITSSTNFSGVTIISDTSVSVDASTLGGADFSNSTLAIKLNTIDLSGVNFQNTVFLAGSSIRLSVANLTDFRGADFSGIGFANWFDSLTWDEEMAPLYDDNTVLTTQSGTIDPVALGWTYAPIPESATYALFAGALTGAVCFLRRRR